MKSFFKQGLFFAIVIAFTACGGNYTYFLNTNNANGLEVGDPVYRQGVAIGEVEDVHFEGDEVQIEIAIEEPMYEGQYFSIRNTVSGHELDLAKPGKDANALAKDAVVRNDYFNGDLLEGLGEALGNSLGNTLGREGEELERSLEKLANRMEGFGENLGERISNQMERAGEGFGEAISNWAEGNEAEFEAFGEEMEAWEEEFEGDADDFVKEMSHISDKHKVGSNAWKREVKELMRNQ